MAEKIRLSAPRKNGQILKLINGVNFEEFKPLDRKTAREKLNFRLDDKIIFSFGNTFEGERYKLIAKTLMFVEGLIPDIKFTMGQKFSPEKLSLYLGACDIVLFPTGGADNEKACFPIRVGTCLNAERVIATDNSSTEFHNTLIPYRCLVTGNNPQIIAKNIKRFFDDEWYRLKLETNTRLVKHELNWEYLIGGLDDFYKAMAV